MMLLLPTLSLALAEDLAVSSNVRGANILINGEPTGLKTPSVITGLAPGMVQVSVQDNCHLGDAVVDIEAGKSNRATVRADETPALLTVEVSPAQAVVDVNGGKVKVAPNVPVELPCGTYEISASLKGYTPVSYTMELVAGQELTLPLELDRLGMSTVEVSVEPRSATIYLDGKAVGQDAVSLPSVFEGLHVISAEAKGYNVLEKALLVGDGDDLILKMELGRGDEEGSITSVGGAGKVALANGLAAATEQGLKLKSGKPSTRVDDDLPEEGEEPEATPTKTSKKKVEDESEDLLADPDEDEGGDEDEEPDGDLAPTLSWSEKHAAEEAAKKKSSSSTTSSKTVEGGGGSQAGLKAGGGVLLGVGAVVAGGGGYYMFTETNALYSVWQGKVDAAANTEDEGQKRRLEGQAEDYYTGTFQPAATLFYGTIAAGSVLAATGLVLLIVDSDGGPIVAPAPGGMLVGWSAPF